MSLLVHSVYFVLDIVTYTVKTYTLLVGICYGVYLMVSSLCVCILVFGRRHLFVSVEIIGVCIGKFAHVHFVVPVKIMEYSVGERKFPIFA